MRERAQVEAARERALEVTPLVDRGAQPRQIRLVEYRIELGLIRIGGE